MLDGTGGTGERNGLVENKGARREYLVVRRVLSLRCLDAVSTHDPLYAIE